MESSHSCFLLHSHWCLTLLTNPFILISVFIFILIALLVFFLKHIIVLDCIFVLTYIPIIVDIFDLISISSYYRRLDGPVQRVHRLWGERDHVPRIHPSPLHPEQQVKANPCPWSMPTLKKTMRFEAFCFLMTAVLSDNVPCVFTSTLAAGEQWPLEMAVAMKTKIMLIPRTLSPLPP